MWSEPTAIAFLLALTSLAVATPVPAVEETTQTTPLPASDADSVYVYYDVVYEGRNLGSHIYAIPPGTPQVEFKCHVVESSSPLKWFLETEGKQRIDLATVDYATQSVETSEKLSWLPEASGPVTTFTLVVKNFTKELAGKYSCEAYKGEKKVGSREYILRVDGEPSTPHNAEHETYPTTVGTPSV